MLIYFSVSNFRSIRDEVVLSLEAASIRELEEDCVIERGPYRLLKGAVIYGANGSGKSNVIAAYDFFNNFIRISATSEPGNSIRKFEPFRLDVKSKTVPSKFEAAFVDNDGNTYRYGFKILNGIVVEEWLGRKKQKGREGILFHRQLNKVKMRNFKEGVGLVEKTRPDALFLSVCVQFNGSISKIVLNANGAVCSSSVDPHLWALTAHLCTNNSHFLKNLEKLFKAMDIGASKITCEKATAKADGHSVFPPSVSEKDSNSILETKFRIKVHHNKFDHQGVIVGEEEFDLFKNESEGTRKLFGLGFNAIVLLQSGGLMFADEFDAKFHPLITKYIVRQYNSKENIRGAQLIVATHDTNLLEYGNYRRDQIWFTEKNETGSTDLYSLVEYQLEKDKKVRKDASYEKDYIQGRYGGIPYLGQKSASALLD